MASIATPGELGVRLGQTLTGTDEDRAQAILDDVSAVARKLSGDSARWTTEDAPDDVKAVVLASAQRIYTNPNGFASEQDGDYSYRIDSDSLPLGGGMFTEAEGDILASYNATSELWSQQITGSGELTRYGDNILENIWNATLP